MSKKKEVDAIQDQAEQPKVRYSFPTVSQCPRCRGTNTRATSTQGKVQYRQCQSAICRNRYTVIGKPVEVKQQ